MLIYALYLLKVTICSGILFGYYWLLLRNKIFHHYNRFYLLASVVLSLALPLVEINIWHSNNASAPQAIKILQVVGSEGYLEEIVITSGKNLFSSEQVLLLFYMVTTIVLFTLFVCMLVRIRNLFTRHRHHIIEGIFFVNTTARGTPFSFLKYIFWNDLIDPESATGNQVFKHELAHVQQKHSIDKLFINGVIIFAWCNPFFWLIRKELNMIHEFVADKIAVEDSDTAAFAAMILQATYPQHRFPLTNSFFYSPIKRRLLMLTKNKNPKAGYIGRILVLPLAVLVFAAFTLKTKTLKSDISPLYNGKKITVVIDAGHGGTDKGAQSLAGDINEKDLTLSITNKIKAINKNANINIVLTRETDIYQSPTEKADFTKAKKADLFISVHISGTAKENAPALSGMSVWVAKDNFTNAPNSKLFASALISEFAKDYKLPVTANPQQRQTGIAVLQGSACPSVLIEAGYITNNTDLAFLQSDAAKETIAGNILAAIEKYAFAKATDGAIAPAIQPAENFLNNKPDTIPEITLQNYEQALIIIDGKTKSKKDLKAINPDNIESIRVLKGKEAITQYGEKGKNGVVIVQVKERVIILDKVTVIMQEDTAIQKMIVNGKVVIKNEHNAEMQPLFILNGKVQEKGLDINAIPPNEIESINVWKDKKAIEKYGEAAIHGVIEIITRNKTITNFNDIPVSINSKNNIPGGSAVARYNNSQEGVTATFSSQSNSTQADILRADLHIQQDGMQQSKTFTKVENEPEFPGGDSAWKNYLVRNLKSDMP
ncbi:MAG: N-acetylmuramoyl-L-alanine amidase [Ferruginibacter sp.]